MNVKKAIWALLAAVGFALIATNKPRNTKDKEATSLMDMDIRPFMNTHNFIAPAQATPMIH